MANRHELIQQIDELLASAGGAGSPVMGFTEEELAHWGELDVDSAIVRGFPSAGGGD